MAPLILAAIQAVMSQKQKKDQEQQQRQLAAQKGVAFQQPSGGGLGAAAGLAGSFMGGGEKKPDAMGKPSNLAGDYDGPADQPGPDGVFRGHPSNLQYRDSSDGRDPYNDDDWGATSDPSVGRYFGGIR